MKSINTSILAVCVPCYGPTSNCENHTCYCLSMQWNYGPAAENSAFYITDQTYSLNTSAVHKAMP